MCSGTAAERAVVSRLCDLGLVCCLLFWRSGLNAGLNVMEIPSLRVDTNGQIAGRRRLETSPSDLLSRKTVEMKLQLLYAGRLVRILAPDGGVPSVGWAVARSARMPPGCCAATAFRSRPSIRRA